MIFSISILKLNALAMWAPKTAFNEELALSRLIAFAFSHRCAGRPARSRWCKSTTMKGIANRIDRLP